MSEEYKVEIIEIMDNPENKNKTVEQPGGGIIKNFYAEHIKTINEKLGSITDYHLINTNVVYNKDTNKTFVYLFLKNKTEYGFTRGGGKKNRKTRKKRKSKNSRKNNKKK
jgi:hypothetical protein